MRLLSILCIALLSCTTTANADPWVMRIETLSRICQAAVKTNDIGTVRNIANQLTGQIYRKILFLLNELSNAWWQHLENKSNRRSKKPKLLAILCQRYLIMIEHYEYYVTSYSK